MIIITKISNLPNFLLLLLFSGHVVSEAMDTILLYSPIFIQVFYCLVRTSCAFPILLKFLRYVGIYVEF